MKREGLYRSSLFPTRGEKMKKRLLIVLTVMLLSIISFQVFAQENTTPQQTSEKKQVKAEKETKQKTRPIGHKGEEFVLLDSLQKKKAELEEQLKVQEEGITPVRIQIPSMDIDTKVIPVGLKESGEMDVPESTEVTGWYDRGPKPGGKGSSVVAGHVDSKEGPAIFFYLKNIEVGETITLTDEKGNERTFKVKSKESYPYNDAPIEKIFGPSDKRKLNVITCTGTFDHDKHEYPDRLVVYTELISEKQKQEEKTPEPPTDVTQESNVINWHAVRADDVIGYRVYKKSALEEEYTHVASISAHERKSFFDENHEEGDSYYVTTVNIQENESKPSEKVPGE